MGGLCDPHLKILISTPIVPAEESPILVRDRGLLHHTTCRLGRRAAVHNGADVRRRGCVAFLLASRSVEGLSCNELGSKPPSTVNRWRTEPRGRRPRVLLPWEPLGDLHKKILDYNASRKMWPWRWTAAASELQASSQGVCRKSAYREKHSVWAVCSKCITCESSRWKADMEPSTVQARSIVPPGCATRNGHEFTKVMRLFPAARPFLHTIMKIWLAWTVRQRIAVPLHDSSLYHGQQIDQSERVLGFSAPHVVRNGNAKAPGEELRALTGMVAAAVGLVVVGAELLPAASPMASLNISGSRQHLYFLFNTLRDMDLDISTSAHKALRRCQTITGVRGERVSRGCSSCEQGCHPACSCDNYGKHASIFIG